jgi:hypothetical protein
MDSSKYRPKNEPSFEVSYQDRPFGPHDHFDVHPIRMLIRELWNPISKLGNAADFRLGIRVPPLYLPNVQPGASGRA